MSFSSRRRNYLLTPHRRDGLVEWMKAMLMHSFVLDTLDTTGADTFAHFEELIEEHRRIVNEGLDHPSRLKQLVPTIGTFHTELPLCRAFEAYNAKHQLTKRRHVYISFNELRHILNLAQIMALSSHHTLDPKRQIQNVLDSPSPLKGKPGPSSNQNSALPELDLNNATLEEELSENSPSVATLTNNNNKIESTTTMTSPSSMPFDGPKMITFDGDQTLYSDGANFEENPTLANYLYLLLVNGVAVAVVTAAGYEYQVEKYMFRLSGLLAFFQEKGLSPEACERFYLFGGECNYLLRLGSDYQLKPVKEYGPGGWMTATKHLGQDGPVNWKEQDVQALLDVVEASVRTSIEELNLRGSIIRKRRAVGLIPKTGELISREALDETVLRVQDELQQSMHQVGSGSVCSSMGSASQYGMDEVVDLQDIKLPFCAFNGGRDVWVDVGNKRVGVQVLQSYLGVPADQSLHIGDQFLNTGNDFAARDVCPCVWITSPEETTYILKKILQLAGVNIAMKGSNSDATGNDSVRTIPETQLNAMEHKKPSLVNFQDVDRRTTLVMDVYTGELKQKK